MHSLLLTAAFSLCSGLAIRRDSDSFIGENLGSVAIDAPGIPYPSAWKGYPNDGEGSFKLEFLGALLEGFIAPGLVPAGLNPESCTPKEGQYPIILIPGTTETPYSNWAFIGPRLAEQGYCVYSFAHNPLKFLNNNTVVDGTAFLGDITESAQALSVVVDDVLARTGAEKVDFVGHSQGAGALPMYYLKNLMKGTKVRKQIGLAPSLGTQFYGANTLFQHVLNQHTNLEVQTFADSNFNTESLFQQLADSDFMKALHEGGIAVDGVEYVNIATKYDDVLLPYTNCFFEESGKQITNILLQDVCALDLSDHLGFSYSNVAYQIVLNQITGQDNPVICTPELPVFNREVQE